MPNKETLVMAGELIHGPGQKKQRLHLRGRSIRPFFKPTPSKTGRISNESF
jgi:hypothetical protein